MAQRAWSDRRVYRHVMVPLDGSPLADRALDCALTIANSLGAVLELVHVHDPTWLPRDGVSTLDPRFDQDRARMMREALDAAAANLRLRSAVPVAATMLQGRPIESLAEYTAASGTDLVVMTTHGHRGWARLRLGSVTDALIRRLSVPILVLASRGDDASTRSSPPFRNVLVPSDDSAFANAAIENAVALDATRTSRYTIFTVVAPPLSLDPFPDLASWIDSEGEMKDRHTMLANDLATVRHQLESVAAPLRHTGLSIEVAAVAHSDPAAAILEHAAASGVDLIALATHGRSRLADAAIGSVARAVLRDSRVPVLVCRPTADS